MAIKIYWTNFAKKQLRNIFDYYKTNASPQIAQNIVVGIVEKVNSLEFQTEIGQKEELLLDRKENFRYLVFKKYKIIYWFNKDKNKISPKPIDSCLKQTEKVYKSTISKENNLCTICNKIIISDDYLKGDNGKTLICKKCFKKLF